MGNIYDNSIGKWRRIAKKRLRTNEISYNSLTNKNTPYAQGLKKLQELHRRVYELYRDADDTLDHTPAQAAPQEAVDIDWMPFGALRYK